MDKYMSFQSAYESILLDLMRDGKEVEIRGTKVKELTPYDFAILKPNNRMLNLRCRKGIYKYIFGELLWYLSGSDYTEFISRYAKYWSSLSDDDIHANSAYGKYIFGLTPIKGHGVRYDAFDEQPERMSQWEFCKNLLKMDPTTRQAVIHIKPVQMYNTADTVCTFYMHFMLRDNKLDLHVAMRSNDVIFGTTYDVFMFTFLQELMAAELGVELGTYYHHVDNMHLYEKDYKKASEILKELEENKKPYILEPISDKFREQDLKSLLIVEKELHRLTPLGRELLLLFLKGDTFYD